MVPPRFDTCRPTTVPTDIGNSHGTPPTAATGPDDVDAVDDDAADDGLESAPAGRIRPSTPAQYGPNIVCDDPLTGSSGMPFQGLKYRDSKSMPPSDARVMALPSAWLTAMEAETEAPPAIRGPWAAAATPTEAPAPDSSPVTACFVCRGASTVTETPVTRLVAGTADWSTASMAAVSGWIWVKSCELPSARRMISFLVVGL